MHENDTSIVIHDVGMRDGLQVEKPIVPTELKMKWIQNLIESGVDIIQIGSFVHPEKVPQMADTDRLFAHLAWQIRQNSRTAIDPGLISDQQTKPDSETKQGSVVLSGLVLNERGLERGMACGVELFCMGISASDTYSRKNTGMSSGEALKRILVMAKRALDAGKKVQVSVQNAFGCSYEGLVHEEAVLKIAKQYLDAGLKNISLADTSGHAHPQQVERLFDTAMNQGAKSGQAEFACHFHETYGLGLTNCYAAMKTGVRYFETSFGGLGGSPFSARSSGNICTEDFIYFLQRMNLRLDVDLDRIIEITKDASQFLNRALPGFLHRIGRLPIQSAQES
ncbi:MAG: hydroxymethylglutaryl-CoA lyase [Acidobacteriota bacterium]